MSLPSSTAPRPVLSLLALRRCLQVRVRVADLRHQQDVVLFMAPVLLHQQTDLPVPEVFIKVVPFVCLRIKAVDMLAHYLL